MLTKSYLTGFLVVITMLGGCSDTPEEAAGKCMMEAASKVGPTGGGGENSHLAAVFLYGQYRDGWMAAKGYKSVDGKWVRQ